MKKSVIGGKHLALSLGFIISRGIYVSGHVFQASFFISGRIRHWNALAEKAWEDTEQGLGKIAPRTGR